MRLSDLHLSKFAPAINVKERYIYFTCHVFDISYSYKVNLNKFRQFNRYHLNFVNRKLKWNKNEI